MGTTAPRFRFSPISRLLRRAAFAFFLNISPLLPARRWQRVAELLRRRVSRRHYRGKEAGIPNGKAKIGVEDAETSFISPPPCSGVRYTPPFSDRLLLLRNRNALNVCVSGNHIPKRFVSRPSQGCGPLPSP